jgi:acyl-coenzyme A synthetase/AMP-(fatty) acid ligase
LPKNATGKVLRRVLRDEREKYEGGSGGKVLAKL